jgi:hypothetical protein
MPVPPCKYARFEYGGLPVWARHSAQSLDEQDVLPTLAFRDAERFGRPQPIASHRQGVPFCTARGCPAQRDKATVQWHLMSTERRFQPNGSCVLVTSCESALQRWSSGTQNKPTKQQCLAMPPSSRRGAITIAMLRDPGEHEKVNYLRGRSVMLPSRAVNPVVREDKPALKVPGRC